MIAGTVDSLRLAQRGALDAIARLRSISRDYPDDMTAEGIKHAEALAEEMEGLWASAHKEGATIESRLKEGAWLRDKKVEIIMRAATV